MLFPMLACAMTNMIPGTGGAESSAMKDDHHAPAASKQAKSAKDMPVIGNLEGTNL